MAVSGRWCRERHSRCRAPRQGRDSAARLVVRLSHTRVRQRKVHTMTGKDIELRPTIDERQTRVYGHSVDYRDIITIEPGKRGGKPVIRGLRITVDDVLSYRAAGMTADQVVADFPPLTLSDVRAVLAYAADRERRISTAG